MPAYGSTFLFSRTDVTSNVIVATYVALSAGDADVVAICIGQVATASAINAAKFRRSISKRSVLPVGRQPFRYPCITSGLAVSCPEPANQLAPTTICAAVRMEFNQFMHELPNTPSASWASDCPGCSFFRQNSASRTEPTAADTAASRNRAERERFFGLSNHFHIACPKATCQMLGYFHFPTYAPERPARFFQNIATLGTMH